MPDYIERMADRRLRDLASELPAVLITGPRAAGKTTTARRLAESVVRLDRPAEAEAFAADPDAALRGRAEPLLLDEWQVVPDVLGAVKRAVDDDPRGGRFLLTGSVRADLDAETWPGTGRVVRLRMYGLTMAERRGTIQTTSFIQRLARADLEAFRIPAEAPDLRGYVELLIESAFPEPALRLSASGGQAWTSGYLDQLLTRDAAQLVGLREPARLRRYFEALALSTAGTPVHRTLYEAAGLARNTAAVYDELLTNLFVLDVVPSWTSNRLRRLSRLGKRYIVDPALVTVALQLDVDAVMADGDLLGRLLDTFVMAQIRPEIDLVTPSARLFHLREKDGRHEIDVVAEQSAG
ncbi:MAG TPA: AAA family ATPase, partial [Solirubrobacteraceae bacterium]